MKTIINQIPAPFRLFTTHQTPTAVNRVIMRHQMVEASAAFSCPNPSKIELTSKSGTGESVQGTKVTGTQ